MNNLLRKLFQNKKVLIIVTSIVLFILGLLAFFPFGERANSLLGNGTTIDKENITKTIFSSFDISGDSIIKLFRDEKDIFNFVDDEDNIIYSTSDNIESFRIINESSLVYLTSYLNTGNNKFVSEVKLVDLTDKSERTIQVGEKLILEVSNDTIYIANKLSGDVFYGAKEPLKKISTGAPIDKLISNKGKVFTVHYSASNGAIRSIVNIIEGDKLKEIITSQGKVKSINVDYDNDNLIYYSSDIIDSVNKTTNTIVKRKYIKNLSPTSSDEEVYTNLNHNIYSIAGKYISIDTSSNSIILLNKNMTKVKTLGTLHKDTLTSLIREDNSSNNIYFINSKGLIQKL